jgi:uncharacterized membrane protein
MFGGMNLFSALSTAIHAVAAVIWVGGMFFAHMALRPSLQALDPPRRLALWGEVFPRFFAWVWAAVVALLVTGFAIVEVNYGGFAAAPLPVILMTFLGLFMAGLYVFLYAVPYRRFRAALAAEDWPAAASHQAVVRRIVTVNLAIGIAVTVLGSSARFWG